LGIDEELGEGRRNWGRPRHLYGARRALAVSNVGGDAGRGPGGSVASPCAPSEGDEDDDVSFVLIRGERVLGWFGLCFRLGLGLLLGCHGQAAAGFSAGCCWAASQVRSRWVFLFFCFLFSFLFSVLNSAFKIQIWILFIPCRFYYYVNSINV
jgi:hypothetical protein